MRAVKWLLFLPFRIIKWLLLLPFKILGAIFLASRIKCPSCKSTNITKTNSKAYFKNMKTTCSQNGLYSFKGEAHRTKSYLCKDCKNKIKKSKSTKIFGGGKKPSGSPSSFI